MQEKPIEETIESLAEEESIYEDEPDSNFRITLYEKDNINIKYPISQKDRIEKSNKLIDSLFVNDH